MSTLLLTLRALIWDLSSCTNCTAHCQALKYFLGYYNQCTMVLKGKVAPLHQGMMKLSASVWLSAFSQPQKNESWVSCRGEKVTFVQNMHETSYPMGSLRKPLVLTPVGLSFPDYHVPEYGLYPINIFLAVLPWKSQKKLAIISENKVPYCFQRNNPDNCVALMHSGRITEPASCPCGPSQKKWATPFLAPNSHYRAPIELAGVTGFSKEKMLCFLLILISAGNLCL